MISKELNDCLPIIEVFMKIKSKKLRESFLLDQYKHNPGIYKAVQEILTNIVHRNIPLEDDIKKKLRRHRYSIVNYIHNGNKKNCRSHLKQSGGYLHYIIPAFISILSSVLAESDGDTKEALQSR